MLQEALDHPQKLYPIIFMLFILLVVLYMKNLGKQRHISIAPGYLGTQLHSQSMAEAIEDAALKIVQSYPTLGDHEQARMVRDKLKMQGLKNVDMYEGTIFATITRLKGGASMPPPQRPA